MPVEYEYEVEVAYEYYILHVRLENRTLPAVIASRLDGEQKELYDILLELKGNNVRFGHPGALA